MREFPDPFGIQATVEYRYDGTGNRIMKKVSSGATSTITTYLRDASGNVMAIYEEKTDQTLAIKEIPIYGSSRLGQYRPKTDTKKTALGQRIYEFSNHLGNVLVTLTDNKVPQTDGTYESVVVSASDYYPFGMAMGERTFSNESYRYGFNGKENDNDFGNDQLIQDYGFRLYAPSIVRFFSVDPLTRSYSMLTPYQFSHNSPIALIDLDGLEGVSYLATTVDKQGKVVVTRIVEMDVYVGIEYGKSSTTDHYFIKYDNTKKNIDRQNSNKAASEQKMIDGFTKSFDEEYNDRGFVDDNNRDVKFVFNIKLFDVAEQPDIQKFADGIAQQAVKGYNYDSEGNKENRIGNKGVVLIQEDLGELQVGVQNTSGKLKNGIIRINKHQASEESASHTRAHEVGHFMTDLHPDDNISDMVSEDQHADAGGIFRYGKAIRHEIREEVTMGQGKIIGYKWVTEGTEDVNQQNIKDILKSVIFVGDEDVKDKQGGSYEQID